MNVVAAFDLLPTPLSFAVAASAGATDSINPRTSDSLPPNEPPATAESQSDASTIIAEFTRTVTAAQKRKDKTFMRIVFDRHAGSKDQLSAPELMAALKEVEAPVLTGDGSSEENMFRRADANLNGAVDFDEYKCTLHCVRACDVILLMHYYQVHARRSVAGRAGNASRRRSIIGAYRSCCCVTVFPSS